MYNVHLFSSKPAATEMHTLGGVGIYMYYVMECSNPEQTHTKSTLKIASTKCECTRYTRDINQTFPHLHPCDPSNDVNSYTGYVINVIVFKT